jgi:hypothetical protein
MSWGVAVATSFAQEIAASLECGGIDSDITLLLMLR